MKAHRQHNRNVFGHRSAMPAIEITPLGAAMSEAGAEKGARVRDTFRKFGYCPVSKLFPHSDLIRDFYNPPKR